MSEDETDLKLCCIGNTSCGKSSLLTLWKHNSFPEKAPLKLDEYVQKFDVDGKTWEMTVVDTRAVDTEDRYRPMNYEGTNVFLICFSYTDPESFDAVAENWVKEVSHHCHIPTPYFLVGLKADLPHQITDEQVQALIKDKTCSEAFTVSAKDGTGTKQLFDAITKAAVNNFKQSQPAVPDKQKAPTPSAPAGNAGGGGRRKGCTVF